MPFNSLRVVQEISGLPHTNEAINSKGYLTKVSAPPSPGQFENEEKT
jgi:hypothetical protein